MRSRFVLALLACVALVLPVGGLAAQAGPAVPESISLPTKIVAGQWTVGTVCLDRVPDAPLEVFLTSDNTFLVEVPISVVISPRDSCAEFPVTTFARGFAREVNVGIGAIANGEAAHVVLAVIPFEGYDLVEITRADVNPSFGHVTIVATSDGGRCSADRLHGGSGAGRAHAERRPLRGSVRPERQQINNVEVVSSLGGCAQRAVPFGNSSTHC